ncbi:protein sidekick-2-like [Asterias amurensis]|uniref:protein sidekick-2-like n=1 Tax=Asterias amurensis TaxID=7602 RepID=UPI003AB77073
MFKIPSDKKGSVGVFTWTYGVNSVNTIRMRPTASLVRAFVSRTVNIGDDVALAVTRNTNNNEISNSKWRRNNGRAMNEDILDLSISSASPSDSGIYECHYKHERAKGNQALLRLIVRGCPQHKYGLTACSSECPRCLNGGVCSDVDGDCICPPGFGGRLCGKLKGPNRFGQKGSLRCDSVGLPHNGSTCKGMLFCLPDPYGCSCAAGYQGLECKTDCDDGTYGANCAQICHCAEGVSCNGATGQCDGDCAAGYNGDNCQVQCTSGEFGENCAHTCHCADVESCYGTTGQCDGNCTEGYKGDNCQVCIEGKFGANCAHICHCAESVSCDGTTGRCIGDCAAGYKGDNCQDTDYKQCLPFGDGLSCNTTCTILDPNIIPQSLNVSSYSADDLFTHTLSWEPVMCPELHFSIVNYEYKVLDGHGSEVEPVEIEYTSVNLNLSICTSYQFKVAARTSKGVGNYSFVSYTTNLEVPNPVTNVTVSSINDTQLTISWAVPVTDAQGHCPAIDYLVTYDLINREQCQMVNRRIDSLITTATTITIDGLEAYSTYRVNVTSRNQAGNSTAVTSTTRTEESRPKAPSVTVNSASTDHIEFAWELPCGTTGGSIIEYKYMYRTKNERKFRNPITTTETLQRISSLTPCALYEFKVRASTSIGEGPWSIETSHSTKKQIPGAVTGLTIKSKRNGQLRVTWTAPSSNRDNHCPATAYELTYELINLEQCQEGNHSGGLLNTTDTTLLVDGLHPYSTYRINVTSRNEAGDGPTKSKSAITTERSFGIAPTFNSSRVTYNTISITWNPIPCGSRGVRITGYGVSLSRQDGQSKRDNLKQVPNTSVSAQFDQLSPCTAYIITVTTIQLRGEGTSFSREIETDTTVPGVVTGLTISRIRHDQLEVFWTAPPGTNPDTPCLATDYLVTYELTNLEQCRQLDHAGVSSLNISDTSVIKEGLKAHSTYMVTVTSRNEAGFGLSKAISKITGERGPQAAPTFNESEVTASSISITWNPIPCGSRGGSITGYRAELYLTGHNQRHQSVDVLRGTSVRFVNLSPCTSYTIVVTTLGTSEGTSFEREETTDTVAPGRVTVLRANPTSGATQIHVTWQNPNANNCPVSKYTVEYQLTNRDQCASEVPHNREQWLDGSLSPTTIAGLYPHSTYIVYVTPSNGAGAGGKASAIVITNDSAPSGPPRDVESTDITNQTIAFSWKQPECGQRNGIITQYHYRLIDSEEGVFEEDTTSSTGIEFTGLVPFTSYTLSVSARNQFALGPVAFNTTRTKEGIPLPPSKVTFPVTRSDRITVAWNAPSPPHGIIISYELRYWKTGSGNQTLRDTIQITKQLASQYQTKTIMALDKSISYSIQVRAETSVGHGPWSDFSTVITVPKGYTLMPFVLNTDL